MLRTASETILFLLDHTQDCPTHQRKHYLDVGITAIKLYPNEPWFHQAAFLHDIIEDTSMTYDQLVPITLPGVALLVQQMTHSSADTDYWGYINRIRTSRS